LSDDGFDVVERTKEVDTLEVAPVERGRGGRATVGQDAGVVLELPPFGQQRAFLNRVEAYDARFGHERDLVLFVPSGSVIEELAALDFLRKVASEVEPVVEPSLVGDERDAGLRVERARGLGGGVTGDASADDQNAPPG